MVSRPVDVLDYQEVLIPLVMIGKSTLLHLISPQRLNARIVLLIAFPLIIVIINKFIHVMDCEKSNAFVFILLLITALGNGFFKEIIWRGVYLKLFPGNLLLRVIWSGICFGLKISKNKIVNGSNEHL